MISESFFLVIAGLFGAVVGSFLNVVILRLPDPEKSIVLPASHCPGCQSPLRWYENLPLLSYLFLLGRCGHCKTTISPQYPLVEAAMLLLSVGLMHKYGPGLTWGIYFCFAAALLVVTVIDLQKQIIPDLISLPGILLGFLFSFVNPHIGWQSSLIGLLIGGGCLYLIALGYYLVRRQEGMGGGDIKLLAMLGAWLGWQSLPFIIFVSSLSGVFAALMVMPLQKKGALTRIPFGPFLCGAALLFLFFQETIIHYFQLYLNGQWP